jgi:hypothetical protein
VPSEIYIDNPNRPADVKSEWWRLQDNGVRIHYTRMQPKGHPCTRCPLLVSNHDRVGEPPLENEGTYTRSTRADLWNHGARTDGGSLGSDALVPGHHRDQGLKTGNTMLCHIRRQESSTPSLGLSERASIVACECTSGAVLQQRELLRYLESRPSRFDAQSAAICAVETVGRADVTVDEVLEHANPALLDANIWIEDVEPLSDDERDRWSQ